MDIANIEKLKTNTTYCNGVFSADLKVTLLGTKKVPRWAKQNEKLIRREWLNSTPKVLVYITIVNIVKSDKKENIIYYDGVFPLTDLKVAFLGDNKALR